ncbi:hypothetical protein [Corynebacterium mayonis]|uniref:hypothetical protein n=1 Tax=Corynebacterium mayonis TaxID=3062461 RepID=UPI00314046DA
MSRNAIFAAGMLVGALALGTVGLSALGQSVSKAPFVNGDQVGMDRGEDWQHYAARASRSLDEAAGDEKAYALITFDKDTDFAQAAVAVAGLGRVGAVVYPGLPPKAVPEPARGQGRETVFDREARRAIGRAEPTEGQDAQGADSVQSVVVYDTGEALRAAAAHHQVAAVEVLPADAVWGAFAVRPASP